METNSEGWLTRPHDMSVMWSRPSTPPKSMKAPKSVMFLTTPSRIWPSSNTLTISSRIRARSSSSTARRETTMLRRALLSLMILKGNSWPMN